MTGHPREEEEISAVTMPLRWVGLIALSILFIAALESLHLPAALLLGPMAAAVVFAASDRMLAIPRPLFWLAQGVVGAMIARAIPASIFIEITKQWPIFVGCVLSVIAASTLLGWLLTRWQVFPGSTAIWGSSPGAATAMTLMAESFGADVRLVAFMQYLRVVIVAVVATLVTRLWVSPGGTHAPALVLFAPVAWGGLAVTLIMIAASVAVARWLRIPAGPLLVSLIVAAILQDTHSLTIELPQLLLMCAYALVGWTIGLRFNRAILRYAAKATPRILLSILSLVGLCGLFAVVLVRVAGIDPLTAYLATSPGGADSVAIIAASSNVDMPFVMAMQTGRFILVLLIGPALSRFMARKFAPDSAPKTAR
ncbi:AbrB family transcriptional regulator [Paramixta manurensis]|uniref:AbrB family transcriptional regulator n=1 Tax=Paramixta manurensis TaxID=2740817 RepID=A0A6M8UE18_9GAMM|nr:AbrB family transcriptional regulator [Erwiniaceae bacterium PD-1]